MKQSMMTPGSEKIEVSVIIPVYNLEQYLEETFRCFQNQSFQNFELICVDDGSTDRSVEIIRKVQASDQRIRLLQQHHRYAGTARNLGLAHARGTYVYFFDGDDLCEPELLEEAFRKAEATDADVVLFDYNEWNIDSDRRIRIHGVKPQYMKCIQGKDVFRFSDVPFVTDLTTPAPWNKFFRRDFLDKEHLLFSSLQSANDLSFGRLSLICAERIAYLDRLLMTYRFTTKGKTLSSGKAKRYRDVLDAEIETYQKAKNLQQYASIRPSLQLSCWSNVRWFSHQYFPNRENSDYLKFRREACVLFSRLPLFDRLDRTLLRSDVYEDIIRYRTEGNVMPLKQQIRMHASSTEEKVPKVSVIIPVYNVEKYLSECLDSICQQTLRDIEIICVDDGSTDSSSEILARYAGKDSRIQIFRQKNQGLSLSRNTGVAHSHGTYLYFCDSDDFLELDALKYLSAWMDEHQTQFMFFDHVLVAEGDVDEERWNAAKNYAHRHNGYPEVCSGIEMMSRMVSNGDWIVCAPCEMIRRDYYIEAGLNFPVGDIFEDNPYTFQAALLAERCGYAPMKFYHYRIRNDSTMGRGTTWKGVRSYFNNLVRMVQKANDVQIDKQGRLAVQKVLATYFWHLRHDYANFIQHISSKTLSALPNGDRAFLQCMLELSSNQQKKKSVPVGKRMVSRTTVNLSDSPKCLCGRTCEEARWMIRRLEHVISEHDVVSIGKEPSLYGTLLDGHVVCSPETVLQSGYVLVVGREVPAWLEGQDVVSVEEFV